MSVSDHVTDRVIVAIKSLDPSKLYYFYFVIFLYATMFATVAQVTREGIFVYVNDSPCSSKIKFFHKGALADPWLLLVKGDKVLHEDGKITRSDFINCFHCHKAYGYSENHQEINCECKEITNKIWTEGVLIEKIHKLYKTGLALKICISNANGNKEFPVIFENNGLYSEIEEMPLGTLVRFKGNYTKSKTDEKMYLNLFALWQF